MCLCLKPAHSMRILFKSQPFAHMCMYLCAYRQLHLVTVSICLCLLLLCWFVVFFFFFYLYFCFFSVIENESELLSESVYFFFLCGLYSVLFLTGWVYKSSKLFLLSIQFQVWDLPVTFKCFTFKLLNQFA